ncbi:MAG: SRPBCC family protein [Pseudomonadota bacterium]
MRLVKWILGTLAVVIVGLVAVGMLLPREVTVERQTAIAAPADKIFPHVNNLKANEAWSPWLGIDPNVETTYSDIAEGVGAKMSWTSDHPQVGNGSMEVIESVPNESVKNALDFGDMGTAVADYKLVEEGGVTTVTWGLTADMGAGPIGRWMGLMMDDWVGADYERGLSNLKALVEG